MNLYERTGLGRPIDLRHGSNLVAVLGTAATGLAAAAVRWIATGEPGISTSASVAIGVFLAWAIARELDPDRPGTATVAMGVAGMLAFFGPTAPAIVGVALLAIRIQVGTVGMALRTADIVIVLVAAGFAGTRPEGWFVVAALVVATAADAPPRRVWLPPAIAAIALGAAASTGALPALGAPSPSSLALMGIAALATVLTPPVTTILSRTDVGSRAISVRRLTIARMSAGLIAVGGGLLAVDGGAATLAPVVAALAAVALASRLPGRSTALTGPGLHRVPGYTSTMTGNTTGRRWSVSLTTRRASTRT